jgi:hypothetical protein
MRKHQSLVFCSSCLTTCFKWVYNVGRFSKAVEVILLGVTIYLDTYCRPDRLWGPPNLLYNGYRELFPGGKAAGA